MTCDGLYLGVGSVLLRDMCGNYLCHLGCNPIPSENYVYILISKYNSNCTPKLLYQLTNCMCFYSPHLCVGFLFWFCIPPPSARRPPPVVRLHNLSSHILSSHNLLTHNLSTHNLSTRRPPPQLVLTHLVIIQLAHTQLVHSQLVLTHLVITQLAHTHLVLTNLSSHTTCSHTTCPHTSCHHTTCSHTTCPLTTCPHVVRLHNLSSHILSSHNLLTHTLSSPTCPHTTCSHTTCPHTSCHHTTCTHTTSTFVLRGRQGTWRHPPSLCVAGVAFTALGGLWWRSGFPWAPWRLARQAWNLATLGDIRLHFAWQAWHLRHWAGSGGAAGSRGRRGVSRGRRGTWRHPPSLCVAGVAFTALGGLWWRSGFPWAPRRFAWQAWHLATSTFVLHGRRGTG